ncbi:MAG TPA: energy-coupling factor transporter transmembrane component T [Marmoricola sp.]|nr:energy-coupling factor transporter transmembrane component T [Marmoricola sp.]
MDEEPAHHVTEGRTRLPRDLHPGAWWLWALGLAATASATTNPLLLLTIAAVAGFAVACRRADHPWSGSFPLYLGLAGVIVLVRVLARVVLGGGDVGHVLVDLPEVPLPHWVAGIHLFGPVTREYLLGGLYDGLRLATIVICVGAANSLADPKRLLKSMPPALYEIGTALVVSVSVMPQLAESVQRVRRARRLRGVSGSRIGRLRGLVVPVLEDALERSVALAAGMDARGYGRSGHLARRQRTITGGLMLTGLAGICVGTYAMLDHTAPRWLAGPMLAAGTATAIAGFVAAGRRVRRTRYRPDRWRLPEVVVAASGIVPAVAVFTVLSDDVQLLHPGVDGPPALTLAALVVVLVGTVAAAASPPPVLAATAEAVA